LRHWSFWRMLWDITATVTSKYTELLFLLLWLVYLASIWTQFFSYFMLGQPSTTIARYCPGTTASQMASCLGKSLAFFGQPRTTLLRTSGVYSFPYECA
jgi:hypothetical protein